MYINVDPTLLEMCLSNPYQIDYIMAHYEAYLSHVLRIILRYIEQEYGGGKNE